MTSSTLPDSPFCAPVAPSNSAETVPLISIQRLLVVDDEELNRDVLSRRLKRSGFEVELASSGLEAIEMVRTHSFDLVLLDHMMPNLSGLEVLEIWRSDPASASLPVIMVTAVAESDRIAVALEAGANDYITKPVDFKVALARILSQLNRKKTETALRLSEERYALALKASRDGLWDWDLARGSVFYAPRWKEMLGLENTTPTADIDAWLSRVFEPDRAAVEDWLNLIIEGRESASQLGYRMMHADGTLRWMSSRAVLTRDEELQPIRLSGSQSDVTDERTVDRLTSLANRELLISNLERLCVASPCQPHAVLLIDLDKFKAVNDTLGHLAGDQLLRDLSRRLEAAIADSLPSSLSSPKPIFARLGGDEFAVLMEDVAPEVMGKLLADKLHASMRKSFHLEGRDIFTTLSIGVAATTTGRNDSLPEHLLAEADAALYEAKLRGRAGTVIFRPEMHEATLKRFELENDLRKAVEENQLEVFYQAKVLLEERQVYGVEALVRWNHPTKGRLDPGTFINLAEETGVIVDIGRWVLRQACMQVRSWHTQFGVIPPLELSVNISPREFQDPLLVTSVGKILQESGFPSECLHLEVTENALFANVNEAKRTLTDLKSLGLHLDIDDFGTGYASLRYLKELPFDLIKVDRYFTQSLGVDEDSGKSTDLIATIISMASALGMEIIAEGVESEPHCKILQSLGCRLGQGYYFSKPVHAEALVSLLQTQSSHLKASPFFVDQTGATR